MNLKITKGFLLWFSFLVFAVAISQSAHIVFATTVSVSSAIPGMGTASTSTPPGTYVKYFYNFALMIGGVLAFGAIVWGGVLYAASAGNPGKQSEGKAWIESALWGLLLLGGAYLILYTINPNLVDLSLPTLQKISIQAPTQPVTQPVNCVAGIGCFTCGPGTTVCGGLCCISGAFLCQHLGGTATKCVFQSSCQGKPCGTSCCAATQKCMQYQKSQSSPVISECL